MKICHITSVHKRYDDRIFQKECWSLSQAGYDVTLIVSDGKPNEINEHVRIVDIGPQFSRRLIRFMTSSFRFAREIRKLEPFEIIHAHDPELLFLLAFLVDRKKSITIYDSHENLPKQIMGKKYIPKTIRKPISKFVDIIEGKLMARCDGLIGVTPGIVESLEKHCKNTLLLRNFPRLDIFTPSMIAREERSEVCFVGGVSIIRGALQMAEAAKKAQQTIHIIGEYEDKETKDLVDQKSQGWIDNLGYHSTEEVVQYLQSYSIGLVVYQPLPNYLDSYPIKLFEYMASGLAVIASNFPMWSDVVNTTKCGICVDPTNVDDIANALKYLIENPALCAQMGKNGQSAVKEKYSWEAEQPKLYRFYELLYKMK